MYDENLLAHSEGSLLPPLSYQDGPKEITLAEKLPALVRGVILNSLLILGGLAILYFWDYSGDPSKAMRGYVIVVMLVAFGVLGMARLLKKSFDPASRESLIVNAEGVFDNDTFMAWEKIKDIRIKRHKVKGKHIYELMIMHKNDFLESQDISALKLLNPDEPEAFHDLRRVIGYYLNH